MIIILTGGTGLVGTILSQTLSKAGHEVRILTRSPKDRPNMFHWNPDIDEIDSDALKNVDVVVHLAGSSVADGRWTSKRKEDLRYSRIGSAQLLYRTLEEKQTKLVRFVSASGIGYYGPSSADVLTEQSNRGKGFLAELCDDWEGAADQFSEHDADVYKLRIGIVMSRHGGFIKKLEPIVRKGLGSVFGSGKQMTSWIHITDLVRLLVKCIDGEMEPGVYNAVAPKAIDQSHLIKLLAKALKRRILLPPTPKLVLKVLFGELSAEILANQNVSSAKSIEQGFHFNIESFEECLDEMYP